MKAQVLIDFIIEGTLPDNNKFDDKSDSSKEIEQSEGSEAKPESIWMLHIDGASNSQRSGASIIFTNSKRIVTKYALGFNFKASNNQAEYEALLASLKMTKKLGVDKLKLFTDS